MSSQLSFVDSACCVLRACENHLKLHFNLPNHPSQCFHDSDPLLLQQLCTALIRAKETILDLMEQNKQSDSDKQELMQIEDAIDSHLVATEMVPYIIEPYCHWVLQELSLQKSYYPHLS